MGYFYPRSPCGERPHAKLTGTLDYSISIHALLAESDVSKRATPARHPYFYPRSPCGERLLCGRLEVVYLHISIHALLAESDFNGREAFAALLFISIHALLAESDPASRGKGMQCRNFYPRSPCGERPE